MPPGTHLVCGRSWLASVVNTAIIVMMGQLVRACTAQPITPEKQSASTPVPTANSEYKWRVKRLRMIGPFASISIFTWLLGYVLQTKRGMQAY